MSWPWTNSKRHLKRWSKKNQKKSRNQDQCVHGWMYTYTSAYISNIYHKTMLVRTRPKDSSWHQTQWWGRIKNPLQPWPRMTSVTSKPRGKVTVDCRCIWATSWPQQQVEASLSHSVTSIAFFETRISSSTNGRNWVLLEISWGFCYHQISPNADQVCSRSLGLWKNGHLEDKGTDKPSYHILSHPITKRDLLNVISRDSVCIPSKTTNQRIVPHFGGAQEKQHVENFSRCRCIFCLNQTFFRSACLHCDESYNVREKTWLAATGSLQNTIQAITSEHRASWDWQGQHNRAITFMFLFTQRHCTLIMILG